jgi:hypothetical protein
VVALAVPQQQVDADVHERVGVDEPRHHQVSAGIDLLVDGARVRSADVEDAVALEHDLAAVEQLVATARRVVADHRPAADADDPRSPFACGRGALRGVARERAVRCAPHQPSLGSSTSRRPSPRRFIDITVAMIPIPGNTVSHHANDMKPRP